MLVPDGTPQNGYASGLPTKTVPAAPCSGGYLIGWVITPTSDTPIKFDGLIGDAVVRTSGTAQAGYNAIPIQADPNLANGAAVTTNANGALMFDGAPGHYQAVTGQVLGDVRYTGTVLELRPGVLTLLTLDVKSNRPNNPVFVDLDFFGGNPSKIGNENQLSTSTEFICWEEVPITSINPDLTTTLMGRKGVFVSAPATKVGIFGISDDTGPTTLLGLSETQEDGVRWRGSPSATCLTAACRYRRISYRHRHLTSYLNCSGLRGGARRPSLRISQATVPLPLVSQDTSQDNNRGDRRDRRARLTIEVGSAGLGCIPMREGARMLRPVGEEQ